MEYCTFFKDPLRIFENARIDSYTKLNGWVLKFVSRKITQRFTLELFSPKCGKSNLLTFRFSVKTILACFEEVTKTAILTTPEALNFDLVKCTYFR